jgi:hypothetical protein
VKDYRIYLVDKSGEIARRIDIQSYSDQAAMAAAKQYIDSYDVEIWHFARRVGRLSRSRWFLVER